MERRGIKIARSFQNHISVRSLVIGIVFGALIVVAAIAIYVNRGKLKSKADEGPTTREVSTHWFALEDTLAINESDSSIKEVGYKVRTSRYQCPRSSSSESAWTNSGPTEELFQGKVLLDFIAPLRGPLENEKLDQTIKSTVGTQVRISADSTVSTEVVAELANSTVYRDTIFGNVVSSPIIFELPKDKGFWRSLTGDSQLDEGRFEGGGVKLEGAPLYDDINAYLGEQYGNTRVAFCWRYRIVRRRPPTPPGPTPPAPAPTPTPTETPTETPNSSQ